MEMPSGRVADVHFFADEGTVWVLLLDVTAEYEEARLVQQKAYDMTLLSQREARLIAQLESANQELTRAHRELAASREALQVTHDRLQQELREAELYVRAMLPAPLGSHWPVDWRFVPSTELGGDSFGYHWVDDEHFALYLIDVCGHGVGSALLSVAVAETLRSGALPRTDFRKPGGGAHRAQPGLPDGPPRRTVLHRLVWRLWPGHRPAALRLGRPSAGPGGRRPIAARRSGLSLAGQRPVRRHLARRHATRRQHCILRVALPGSIVFSDGTYEISRPDGSMLEFSAMTDILDPAARRRTSELDSLLAFARDAHGGGALEDDFTIIRMTL